MDAFPLSTFGDLTAKGINRAFGLQLSQERMLRLLQNDNTFYKIFITSPCRQLYLNNLVNNCCHVEAVCNDLFIEFYDGKVKRGITEKADHETKLENEFKACNDELTQLIEQHQSNEERVIGLSSQFQNWNDLHLGHIEQIQEKTKLTFKDDLKLKLLIILTERDYHSPKELAERLIATIEQALKEDEEGGGTIGRKDKSTIDKLAELFDTNSIEFLTNNLKLKNLMQLADKLRGNHSKFNKLIAEIRAYEEKLLQTEDLKHSDEVLDISDIPRLS